MVELPAALGFWTSWGCGVPVGPGEREHLVLCSCSLWSACYRLALRRPGLRAWVLKIDGSRPIRLSRWPCHRPRGIFKQKRKFLYN